MVDVGVGKFSKGVFTGDFQEEMPWGDEGGDEGGDFKGSLVACWRKWIED
jgi:hypothetical protein